MVNISKNTRSIDSIRKNVLKRENKKNYIQNRKMINLINLIFACNFFLSSIYENHYKDNSALIIENEKAVNKSTLD